MGVTKVSSERIVTSSTMFLLLLLGSGLSLSNAAAAEPTAELTVYYEALCGDSINFVTTQLTPAWEMFGEDLVINFKPFGKANWTENGDSWDFVCQHGPDECFGNKAQACILVHEPYDARTAVPLIDCLMRTHTRPDPAVGPCLAELGLDVPPEAIMDCAAGDQGSELLHALGVETHDLDPALYFVPWILFNGEMVEEDWQHALYDLAFVLCDKYLTGHSKCNDIY